MSAANPFEPESRTQQFIRKAAESKGSIAAGGGLAGGASIATLAVVWAIWINPMQDWVKSQSERIRELEKSVIVLQRDVDHLSKSSL